jgi:hypothetical protein
LVVYVRTGQLRRALQLTILSFMVIKAPTSGILATQLGAKPHSHHGDNRDDRRERFACCHDFITRSPPGPRRRRLRIQHLSWQDAPSAMDRSLQFWSREETSSPGHKRNGAQPPDHLPQRLQEGHQSRKLHTTFTGRNSSLPDNYSLSPESSARLMTRWRERALEN